MNDGFYFRSTLFEAMPGEDEETNPGIYGRQLAQWLRERMLAGGYAVEEIIAEDWGWCVLCQRDPYALWIGCANMMDPDILEPVDPPPSSNQILWHAFAEAEVPFLRRLLRRVDPTQGLAELDQRLKSVLVNEPEIVIVDADGNPD